MSVSQVPGICHCSSMWICSLVSASLLAVEIAILDYFHFLSSNVLCGLHITFVASKEAVYVVICRFKPFSVYDVAKS